MKKVLCALLAVVMLLSLVACTTPGTKPETNNGDNEGSASEPTNQESIEQTQETQETEELKQFKLPRISYYCKVPMECMPTNNGRSTITSLSNAYIATIFTGDKGQSISQLEDILVACADQYVKDVNDYLMPDIKAESLKADSTERVTVSGYEAVKFTGNITNKSNGTYKIHGYSMIIEERPVMFLGILVSEDQADADLNAMEAFIDQMAGSIFQ